jgi:hypothetical protein
MVLTFGVSASAEPTAPPSHLDPLNRTVWSDDRLGIRFTYPPVWQEAVATQASTRAVINWRLSKSKALLASCYLETHGPDHSTLAMAPAFKIHANADTIAQSALRNFKARAPDAQLIESRPAVQDGHPVIYIVRQGTIETLDRRTSTKSYSMATSWNKTEVNFECATTVFGPEYTSLQGGQKLIDQVEAGILHVMNTLQFDRIPR